MKVSPTPPEQLEASKSDASTASEQLLLFETVGTENCTLSCPTWRRIQWLEKGEARSNTEKREMSRELRDLRSGGTQDASFRQGSRDEGPPFTLAELSASAARGCGSCRLFELLLGQVLNARQDLPPDDCILSWIGIKVFLVRVTVKNTGQSVNFQFFSGSSQHIVGMPPTSPLTGDTGMASSFDRAQRWIRECETSHRACGVGQDVPLPKRLIDLTPIWDGGEEGVRLEVTEGRVGTYACLSHCWGKHPINTRTIEATLDQYRHFIAWNALPRTFQDAARLTRRLGIRYIWIDSLCIVQNSIPDWQTESGNMANIYRESAITIAARQEDGGDLEPGLVIVVRDCQGAGLTSDEHAFARHFPLFTRAWTYQERLLSRRVLMCMRGELQLECRVTTRCECKGRQHAPHFSPQSLRHVSSLKSRYAEPFVHLAAAGPAAAAATQQQQLQRQQKADAVTRDQWRRLVVEYSRLSLTKRRDMLPALSGCAKDMSRLRRPDDAYLAGLWRRTLAEDLLWYVRPPVRHRRPSRADWRTPTWSWAAVDDVCDGGGRRCGIEYIADMDARAAEHFNATVVEAASCTANGLDGTGEASAGFLRPRVPEAPLSRLGTPKRWGGQSIFALEIRGVQPATAAGASNTPCNFPDHCGLDVKGADVKIYVDTVLDLKAFDFIRPDVGKWRDEQGENSPTFTPRGSVPCMITPVSLLYVSKLSKSKESTTHYFLILVKAASDARNPEGCEDSTYERIGLAVISHGSQEKGDTWLEEEWPKVLSEESSIIMV